MWRKVKADPDFLITSGELKVVTPMYVDDKGELHKKTGIGGLISPLRLTWPQRKLHMFPQWCNERGLPVSSIVLKGRRVGLSSYVQARLFSSAISSSGVKNAVVANVEDSAKNLLRMSRTYYAQLTGVNRLIMSMPNNESQLGFASQDKDFEVSDSSILCSTASPEGLERFLGSGTLRVHLSEAAFYDDPEKVEQVLSATIMRIPGAEVWRESASNGENNHFGVEFLTQWRRQNNSNFWDPTFNLNENSSNIAIFFSFFSDPQNRVPLRAGKSQADFIENFDEYEKDLFFNIVVPYQMSIYPDRHVAYEIAIQNMCFRRSVLPRHYEGGFAAMNHPFPLTEKSRFKAEYPATPEEAFEGSGLRTVLPPDVLLWTRESCLPPVFEGYLSEGGVKGFTLTESVGGDVQLWKMPWETSGNLSLSLDPNDGIEGQGAGDNQRRDYSAATIWDNETGEQVAEFRSQDTDTDVARKIYALLTFMATVKTDGGVYSVSERRLPFFTQECAGPRIVNYCVRDRGYPLERVYIDTSMRSTDIRPQKRLGWTSTSASKPEAVKAFKEYMLNGYETRAERGARGIKRRIIRSRRLADELGWFVVKPAASGGHSKYEALDKGNWTPTSKDDLVMSLVIDCWAQEHRLAVGDLLMQSSFDEEEEKALPRHNHPLSTTESIALERRLLEKGQLAENMVDSHDWLHRDSRTGITL